MLKYTALYCTPDNITNLKIKIKIFENDALIEEKIFRWQQKVFGRFERNFYIDIGNCVTDLEKKYHEDISKEVQNDYFLFSYVNADKFQVDSYNDDGSEAMHLMADLCELKPTVLCSINYNEEQKHFTIFPDFTLTGPYTVQIEVDTKKIYHYYIEDVSEKMPLEYQLKESEILGKISSHQIKLRLNKSNTDFKLPPKNKLNVYLFCEILCGSGFEYDDVYVQYVVDLPKNWNCNDNSTLIGSSFCSRSTNSEKLHYFGFPFEVHLDCNLLELSENAIKAPCMYFEVVSKDSWDRFRSEGVAYTVLPIFKPGVYNYTLRCSRICLEGLKGNLRRFFIGDFSSCSNANWVGVPKNDEEKTAINKYGIVTVASGQINIRFNVLQQSQTFADEPTTKKSTKFILEKLNTSGLIKSVEQVVAAFKIAKRKMIEAKKSI